MVKMDFQKALRQMVSDRCKCCKTGIKAHGDYCQRCLDRAERKQSVTAKQVLGQITADYLTAELSDFPQIQNQLENWKRDTSLFFYGEPGTGKTRAIYAMLKKCLLDGCTAERYEFTALCSMIRDTYNQKSKETENSIIKKLSNLDVLFVDDLGISDIVTNFEYEVFYRIIDSRVMACLPTVISSNKSPEHIGQIFDKRIQSRLQIAEIINFTGEDKRKQK